MTMRNRRDLIEFSLDRTEAGRVASRPIQYQTGFSLLPGKYAIKVLARDATAGRVGMGTRAGRGRSGWVRRGVHGDFKWRSNSARRAG